MRLILLGLIFLLLLTLGNSLLLRRGLSNVNAGNYPPLQVSLSQAVNDQWSAFAWRELGAAALTLFAFGVMWRLRPVGRR